MVGRGGEGCFATADISPLDRLDSAAAKLEARTLELEQQTKEVCRPAPELSKKSSLISDLLVNELFKFACSPLPLLPNTKRNSDFYVVVVDGG